MEFRKLGNEYWVHADGEISSSKALYFGNIEDAISTITGIREGKPTIYANMELSIFHSVFFSKENEFCLKVHNKGEYERVSIDSKAWDNDFGDFIGKSAIKDYNYVEYIGENGFESAYKECLAFKSLVRSLFDQDITLMVYNGHVYLLEYRFTSPEYRNFQSYEDRFLEEKYHNGAKKGAKRGLAKAQAMGRALDYICMEGRKGRKE